MSVPTLRGTTSGAGTTGSRSSAGASEGLRRRGYPVLWRRRAPESCFAALPCPRASDVAFRAHLRGVAPGISESVQERLRSRDGAGLWRPVSGGEAAGWDAMLVGYVFLENVTYRP